MKADIKTLIMGLLVLALIGGCAKKEETIKRTVPKKEKYSNMIKMGNNKNNS